MLVKKKTMEQKINSHKDLVVWQKSICLVENIFKATESFPQSELYGLVSQMRRAAVAIPSNIAEGANRNHTKEYLQFLAIAEGSANELETQLIISEKLKFINKEEFEKLVSLLIEIMKMIYTITKKLSANYY